MKIAWSQQRNVRFEDIKRKKISFKKITLSSNSAFQQHNLQGTDAAWEQQGSWRLVQEAGSQEEHSEQVSNACGSTRRQGCKALAKPLLVTGTWHQASHSPWAKRFIPLYQTRAWAIHQVHLNQASSFISEANICALFPRKENPQ